MPTSLDNGIHHWSDRGGIVGRAVLLDYVAHAKRNAIAYSPWSRHEITVADLEAMIDYEKVRLKPADILIVRSGWVKMHDESNDDTRNEKVKNNHFFAGLQGSEETIKWLWNHKFSAVAGDSITFVSQKAFNNIPGHADGSSRRHGRLVQNGVGPFSGRSDLFPFFICCSADFLQQSMIILFASGANQLVSFGTSKG